jgi:hypothetical protein
MSADGREDRPSRPRSHNDRVDLNESPAFESALGLSPRELLKACDRHQQNCIAAGEVTLCKSFVSTELPPREGDGKTAVVALKPTSEAVESGRRPDAAEAKGASGRPPLNRARSKPPRIS